MGAEYNTALHVTASARLGGLWEVPEFVLRRPLDYDAFARVAFFLSDDLAMTAEAVAEALGVRPRDVEAALELWAAHLERRGAPCETCGRPLDPAWGRRCTRRCR